LSHTQSAIAIRLQLQGTMLWTLTYGRSQPVDSTNFCPSKTLKHIVN